MKTERIVEIAKELLAKAGREYAFDKVEQGPDGPYDLNIEGKYDLNGSPIGYRAWLPLLLIRETVDWTDPRVASMTDYPSMARAGDWFQVETPSGVKAWISGELVR